MQLQYWNYSLALQTQSLLAKSSWMTAQSSILLQNFKWKDTICTWKSLVLFAKSSECYATLNVPVSAESILNMNILNI